MGRYKCKYTLPSGKEVDLYYVGQLATALGRTPDTIRKWELAGIIPSTCFRDKLGCRLYTAEQIEAAVRVAEKCKIMQGKRMGDTTFTKQLTVEFKKLEEKYKGGGKDE